MIQTRGPTAYPTYVSLKYLAQVCTLAENDEKMSSERWRGNPFEEKKKSQLASNLLLQKSMKARQILQHTVSLFCFFSFPAEDRILGILDLKSI